MHELELAALHDAAEPWPRTTIRAATHLLQGNPRPTHAAFVARAMNAVARLAGELDEADLMDAVGEASDYGVLLQVLSQPEAVQVLSRHDPLASAKLRGAAIRAQLLEAEGGVLSAEETGRHLGITRQAVDKRRRAGRLLALNVGKRGYAYPAWQLGPNGLVAGMEQIFAEMREVEPWIQASFFLGDNTYLDGVSPLAALRAGNIQGALRAARAYGEQGAP